MRAACRLSRTVLFQAGYLALNASRPPFSDRTVRRGATFAVNRAKLALMWQQVPTDQFSALPLPHRGANLVAARGVVQAVERVNRLSERKRQVAAAALANRLTANVVPVIPDGIHVQGELFGPRVGCRVFPPGGVDLAALCRN